MRNRIRVMIVQRIFAHYRKSVFDRLNELYDFSVVHSRDNSGIEQVITKYSILVKKISFFGSPNRLFLFMLSPIIKKRPDVIIHEFSIGIFSLPFVYFLSRIMGVKLVLWSHGYNRKKGFNPEKSFSDKVRLFYVKLADALLLYGEKDKELFSKYINKSKIFVAKNTFDTSKLLSLLEAFEREGKEILKQKLGINFKYNLIFIGRLIKSKKPEILVKIYEVLKEKLNNNIGIHFIGDGEEKINLKEYVERHNYGTNFFFHGPIYEDKEIGQLLYCCDLMVLPGECGLSVVHALSFGAPVITFISDNEGPFHGPEIEYVIPEKTGFLIEKDNIELMSNVIFNYLLDEKKQRLMHEYIINFVKNELSVENMIKGFNEVIDYCIRK